MNIKEIKEMIKIMDENNLIEFEIEKEGFKLRLKKGAKGEIVASEEMLASLKQPTAHIKEIPAITREAPKKQMEIKAPMVGTFYRAPAPNASPFVEVGTEIEEGQVVCIIEAMKLMNEIKSEVKGKVAEILVENGEPIEFGQVLFLVEPT